MPSRDELRQDPFYGEQDLDERGLSERDQIGYVRPEDREEYRSNLEASQGYPYVRGVAYTALLAAGAYVGLRHFAPQQVRNATKFIQKQMTQLTQRKGGSGWLTQVQQWLSRSGPGARQGVARAELSGDLEHDVRIARELYSARAGYIGNRDQVLSAMLNRYASTNPNSLPVPATWPQQIASLSSMPAFQRASARLGMHSQAAAAQLAQAAIEPAAPTMGESIAKALSSVRFPFTMWRPLELLAPTELLKRGPVLAHLAQENIYGVPELAAKASAGMQEAMYMGGRIFGVSPIRQGMPYKVIGAHPLATGYQIGRLGSGMGKAAAIRMGATIAKPLSEILLGAPQLGQPLQPGQGFRDILRQPGMSWWNKIQRVALEAGERYGIGPQYSPRMPLGGHPRNILESLHAAATRRKYEYTSPQNPVWGVTPEGAWLKKNLFGPLGWTKLGQVKSRADLTWWERLQMFAGIEPKRAVESIRGGRVIREKQAIGHFLSAAGLRAKQHLPFTKTAALRGEFYAYKGARQGLSDWVNYHINRPGWLLQELTGLGLKQGKTPLESLWKIGTRVAAPAYFGWQALQYADYKSRSYFGYGPISGPAVLYTKMRSTAQEILDSVGITNKARELEEKYPGLVDSPLSRGFQAVAFPLGGAHIGRALGGAKGGMIGLILGATAGFLGATGVTKPAEELRQIYQGEKEVPVHADRWWALGRQPFGGSRIKYWKKHWLAEYMSDYRDTAIYGNRKEAWRGSWLPTPENWFLLKNLYDPYYVENLHYYDRPYPTTSPMFEDVPLVGGVLGATVGRLLKPTMYRPVEMPNNYGLPHAAIAGNAQADALGMSPYMVQQAPPMTKWRLSQMTGETLHRLFEWTGLPGFAAGAMKETITGQPGWFERDTLLAASGMMTSTERSYYEKNLGGLLGMTEFIRRFIPRGRRNAIYNPIENVAPDWLPGHRSVFPGDRTGYLDFHSGDPYTALEKGEARLPGPGYESLHDLHSLEAGVYDDFDKFKILSDIAPFSDAFKYYKRTIEGQIQQGELSKQDLSRYYQTIDNLDERIESRISTYSNRFSTGAFASDTVTIERLLSGTQFQVQEMPGVTFQLAGVKDRVADMDSTQLGQFNRLKNRMSQMVGEQIEMTWGGSGVITPAIIGSVNREAIASGLEADRLNGLGYQAKYGVGGAPAAYEKLIHTELPAPLDYFRTKWLGTRSPVEEYEQFQVYGTANTNWSHPFKNYILPWYHSWTHTPTAESYRARQITGYMDRLQYLKYQQLASMAEQGGNAGLAMQLRHDARHSLEALQPSEADYWKNIYSALPPAERPYFNAFAGTTGEEEQERIIEAVPEYMRHHYIGLWKRKMPGGEFNSPILQRYADEAETASKIPVDVRVAEFFGQYPTPPKDWMGWHPGVDLESITIRTAQSEGLDIHQLGYWESQALQAEKTFPELEGPEIERDPSLDRRDNLMSDMARMGYTNIRETPNFSDDGNVRVEVKRSRRSYLERSRSPFNAASHTGGEW